MAWYSEIKEVSEGIFETHVWEDEKTSKKKLVFLQDKAKKTIIWYPKPQDNFVVKEVLLDGFERLPPEFSNLGYIKSAGGFLNSRLALHKVNSLTISKLKENSFRKLPGKKSFNVVLNYASFSRLKNSISAITTEAKLDKASYTDEFFYTTFPSHYKRPITKTSKARVRRAVESLDSTAISDLTNADIEKLISFFSELIAKRYTSESSRNKLLSAAKIKVDQVAIKDVVKNFEKLLKNDVAESEWGKFLQTNLFLLNPEYVGIVPELNLMLGSPRKVDFGLINSTGYLDIFEIKKSSTSLLAKTKDRGNFYWSTEATKAIAQAEKYLYNAEIKAPILAKDIERERNVKVQVIKPKVILVMGDTRQLDTAQKQEDFRVMRSSFKNVEIVLYDEMLVRLKNQLGKVFSHPNIDTAEANKLTK